MSSGAHARGMAWFLIVIAGLFETGFAVLLKQSHGITRLWPTVGFAVCALISFGLLTIALRQLEVGPAYAVWTGVGAAGTAIVGMVALSESVSTLKIVSIVLVLIGVIPSSSSVTAAPPTSPAICSARSAARSPSTHGRRSS
jgi:quaternary ammonium compound-resistance protein SugE